MKLILNIQENKTINKNTFMFILILFLMFSTYCYSKDFPLLGTWKSHEFKTLDSMSKIENITKKAKDLFEKDFFGDLILDFKQNEFKSYIPGETDDLEEFNKYHPFEIITLTNEYVELKTYNKILEEQITKKYYFDGECIYVFTTKWKFKEYFCRVSYK